MEVRVRVGKLHRDTYLYFVADGDGGDFNGLLDKKIFSWNGYWLQRVKLPAGSPVIASNSQIYITVGDRVVTIVKVLNKFFFKVSDSSWKLIVFPDGAPPYPYPISLIA